MKITILLVLGLVVMMSMLMDTSEGGAIVRRVRRLICQKRFIIIRGKLYVYRRCRWYIFTYKNKPTSAGDQNEIPSENQGPMEETIPIEENVCSLWVKKNKTQCASITQKICEDRCSWCDPTGVTCPKESMTCPDDCCACNEGEMLKAWMKDKGSVAKEFLKAWLQESKDDFEKDEKLYAVTDMLNEESTHNDDGMDDQKKVQA